MQQPTEDDWVRNASTCMSRRSLEVRSPCEKRPASALFHRLCDASVPALSSRLLKKSSLLTHNICSIYNDCTDCHTRMNQRAPTSLSADAEHRFKNVALKLTENTNAGGYIHQRTWRPSVSEERFRTSDFARSFAGGEMAHFRGKYGSHSAVRGVSFSAHKSLRRMANDTRSKFHRKSNGFNRMSPKYTNPERVSMFLKSENSKSSENVSTETGSETRSYSVEYPMNIMWEFEQNNAKPEEIIKLIPKSAQKILSSIKKSVKKGSDRRKASVSASPASASPTTETEAENFGLHLHAKTTDCWSSLKEKVNRHTSPIKDKMKAPRFQAIKDKLESFRPRRVPGHRLERGTKPITRETGGSSPETGEENVSTDKQSLFRKPSFLRRAIGQSEKRLTPSTKNRTDESKITRLDQKASSRNRNKMHPTRDDKATVDKAKAHQKGKPVGVDSEVLKDPFYESFLDDLNAEFTLRGPQKDTDLLMKQLRLNALKLVELEQEYRAGKLQPTEIKKKKKKKKKTSASPMSVSPQEPFNDQLFATQDQPVETETAKEMDNSLLNHEEGGVVQDLLDHGVLSPSELVEAAHGVQELTETLALPIAEMGFPDLTLDVPKPTKKIEEADVPSFELDGVKTENVEGATTDKEPVNLDAEPEMNVQSDQISGQISAKVNPTIEEQLVSETELTNIPATEQFKSPSQTLQDISQTNKNETYFGVDEKSAEQPVDVNADRIAEDAIVTKESLHIGSDAINVPSRDATKDELQSYIPMNTSLFRHASDLDSTKSTFTQKTRPTTPDSPVKGDPDISVDAVQDSKTGFAPDSLQTAEPSDLFQGHTDSQRLDRESFSKLSAREDQNVHIKAALEDPESLLYSTRGNSLLEILCSKRQMSTRNLPQKYTGTEAGGNVLGKYRSSVQKIRHISAMTPHSGLIRYSKSTYASFLCPSSSKLRAASEFPPRARRVYLRMNKQLHQLDDVRDLRTTILPEPRESRATPTFDYPEPFRFAPPEQTAENVVSPSDPKSQPYSLHEKPAGDLVKTQTTPKKLAENVLHFEIRSPSSVVTKSGEEVKGAKAVSSVGIGQKTLDSHLPQGAAIHIRCTRPEPSTKKKLGDTPDQSSTRSRTAQPQESELVVWQDTSQLNHIPGEEHKSLSSPSLGSTLQDASLFSPKSYKQYRSASVKLMKELEKLELCSRLHHRSANLLKRKYRKNCQKLISFTWDSGWQNNTSSSPVTLNHSDDVNSKALTENTNLGMMETSAQLGQADRISVESAEAAGPSDRSDDITFSICITERSDSSSSHCSDKLAKFIQENRHLLELHDCQKRKPRCHTELLYCCSDDSDSQSSEHSHCWCEIEERRRCCCRNRRAGRRTRSSTSSREPNPFRLYHLATNLKNISTELVYRKLKTLLLRRMLLKRALTERIMEDLCRIQRLGR